MRRKDREMSEAFALGVVDACEWASLSMVDAKGAPYCVPISIVREGEDIYFHCAKIGSKIDALRANPRVCIVCVGRTHRPPDAFTTEFESAILFGSAGEVTKDAQKTHALRLLCQRHTPANMHAFERAVERSLARTGVWRVRIEQIAGKRKGAKKEEAK